MFLKGISEIKRIMNGYYFPLVIELRTLDKNLFHFCFFKLACFNIQKAKHKVRY